MIIRKHTLLGMTVGVMVMAGSAYAQPQSTYNVEDASGNIVGTLGSSDSISQGVVLRIRSFDGTICGGPGNPSAGTTVDNDCEDAEYLLIPWNSETPGYTVSLDEPSAVAGPFYDLAIGPM